LITRFRSQETDPPEDHLGTRPKQQCWHTHERDH